MKLSNASRLRRFPVQYKGVFDAFLEDRCCQGGETRASELWDFYLRWCRDRDQVWVLDRQDFMRAAGVRFERVLRSGRVYFEGISS